MVQSTTQVITDSFKNEDSDIYRKLPCNIGTDYNFKRKIVWFNVVAFVFLHLAALYGFYLGFHSKLATAYWSLFLGVIFGLGITVGAHRFYTHRSFKAIFALRLILLILQTGAGQNCMYIWVRDHRQHHKYTDTDADPHNANRGFFFSHVGWLMSKKHPLVIEKGKGIDMSDLEADPLVMFQKKYYTSIYLIFGFLIPILVPYYIWNETLWNSLFVAYFCRYIFATHSTWSVNSIAHLYGTRPYDRTLKPVESKFVALVTLGEGWHNYHHAFPWDYRTAELGSEHNFSAFVIDVLADFGMAYDLRSAHYSVIERRAMKKGDGSHPVFGRRTGYIDRTPNTA